MKWTLHSGMGFLFCGISLFAQTVPPSTEQQKADTTPATSSDQKKQQITFGPPTAQQIERAARALVDERRFDRILSHPRDVDILSDTMGVDFGPYLQGVLKTVRQNWVNLIPGGARPPIVKQGDVAIEFYIFKDGSVSGLELVGSSGDVSMDRAAWGGITASAPFPALPSEFQGQYLELRIQFKYNPPVSISSPPDGAKVAAGATQQFSAAVNAKGDKTIIWSVSGSSCTADACGTISPSGLYTAPRNLSVPLSVTVTATLAADPTESAAATVTVQESQPSMFVCSNEHPRSAGPCANPPKVTYRVDPTYSEGANRAGLEGKVRLRVFITPEGIPRDISVIKDLGMGLGERAVEAVSKWRFDPATIDGKPVAVKINVEINFRLHHKGQAAKETVGWPR